MATLRMSQQLEIGQDSDSPDSDSGSEMELESQRSMSEPERAIFKLIKRISINNFNICAHLI